MCGIIGYTGNKDVLEVLIAGLKRLQYRGYDSCGMAILSQDELTVAKEVGLIERLEQSVREWKIPEGIGIAHTRWATHGAVTKENAHPHLDCNGEIAIVHNGIIENYHELREDLIEREHIIRSGTDTEIVAHLIEENIEDGLCNAMRKAVEEVEGTYALACVSLHAPEGIVVARKGSPLIIGLGKDENIVASDIPALLPLTREVDMLDDGEIAWVTADEVRIWNADGEERPVEPTQIALEISDVDKEGFPSFMLKEIFEQPSKLENIIKARVREDKIVFEELSIPPRDLVKVERFILKEISYIHATGYPAGELKHGPIALVDQDTPIVCIAPKDSVYPKMVSNMEEVKSRGGTIIAVATEGDERISQLADEVFFIPETDEDLVPMLAVIPLQLLAHHIAVLKGLDVDKPRNLAKSVTVE